MNRLPSVGSSLSGLGVLRAESSSFSASMCSETKQISNTLYNARYTNFVINVVS